MRNPLIGETIRALYTNTDRTVLVFLCDSGKTFELSASDASATFTRTKSVYRLIGRTVCHGPNIQMPDCFTREVKEKNEMKYEIGLGRGMYFYAYSTTRAEGARWRKVTHNYDVSSELLQLRLLLDIPQGCPAIQLVKDLKPRTNLAARAPSRVWARKRGTCSFRISRPSRPPAP
jgi:hypothetical protein